MSMKEVVQDFRDFLPTVVGGRTRSRSIKTHSDSIRVLLKYYDLPLTKPTVEDIQEVLEKRLKFKVSRTFSKDGNKLKPGRISNNTYNTSLQALRHWLRFHGIDPDEKPFSEALNFKKRESRRVKTAKDLLKPEDVKEAIEYFRAPVWKAYTAVLWDTGARPSELCSLDYKDVERDKYGFVIHVQDSKTNTRALRLITEIGIQWFQFWYRQHPGEGPLFYNTKDRRLTSNDVSNQYSQASDSLGIDIWATLFRKSSSTWWKASGLLSNTAIRKRLGHTFDSKTFERHYHQYFDEDYEEEELKALGIVKEREVEKKTTCWNCGFSLSASAEYCPNCNTPQGEELAKEPKDLIAQLIEELKASGDLRDLFREVLSEIQEQSPESGA